MLSMHVRRAGSLSFNINFSEPQSPANPRDLIISTGDAYLTPDTHTLELTATRADQSSTYLTGRAQYAQQVPLWDRASGEKASFTTTFYFQITPDKSPSAPGDGMAFFLGHFQPGIPRDSYGASLGLLPAGTNGTGDSTIVAVEFDTVMNPANADISESHIGIDVNSLNSTAATDTTSPRNNLTSGYPMVATVRYENVSKLLAVDLSINNKSYNVNATVDLRSYLPENVAVGFSAATGLRTEKHQILSWSFSSTLEPKTPTMAPAQPPEAPVTSKHPQRVILISILVPLLSLLACAAVGLLLWRQHKTKSRIPNQTSDSDCEERPDRAELERGVAASGPRRYTYRELAAATNNFSDDEKLGRGGFGSVYRGKIAVCGQDRPVAIKMFSSESSAQGRKEFEAEVKIISRLKHRNLVQLLGWCDSRSGLLLVYELVAEGSLHKHLYSSERFLTWPQRYQIILGLGSALRYLHQEWEQCVVHGDIKPSNIMLDESLSTKLGDFGLARLGEHGAKWHTTRAVLGTAGYIDPEFVNTGHPSTEMDVYSFGIVLLEIISSRSPVILQEDGSHFILLKWVWGLYGRNAILDAAAERLRGDEFDEKCMERVLVVGLWCAHPEQSERPSIAQAMHVLQSEDARLPVLPLHMYKKASNFAVTGRAYGSLSIDEGDPETDPLQAEQLDSTLMVSSDVVAAATSSVLQANQPSSAPIGTSEQSITDIPLDFDP
ncbi:L-type lectin-domain containing receptor kinase IX.1 [Dichanthelium oligosanthes]|uniref:non-specific serine/threonine protein kinase n=1 Tax=Dichanthelium oligosanthes TaxID=888268 RepID=A0A1E5V827_9POAL|nr:L-type lectin-domain containing receptor kinase IX.1 [Dichanthelium oligosanthes]